MVDWGQAICTQVDPEMWFGKGKCLRAVEICHECPVQRDCLEFALAAEKDVILNGIDDGLPRRQCIVQGVFGGKTAKERRVILSKDLGVNVS